MSSIKFSDLLAEMQETFNRKNKDYGNSFDALFEEYDFLEPLMLLETKFNRLKQLTFENTIKELAIRLIRQRYGDVDNEDIKDLICLLDKYMGINAEVDESIDDTLKDMANYATMTRLVIKTDNNEFNA